MNSDEEAEITGAGATASTTNTSQTIPKSASYPATPATRSLRSGQKWSEYQVDPEDNVTKSPRPADVYSEQEWSSVVQEITQMDKSEKRTEFKNEVQTFYNIYYAEEIQNALKDLSDLEESAEDFQRRYFRLRFLWDRITPTNQDIKDFNQVKQAVYTIRDHQMMVEQQSKSVNDEETERDHGTQDVGSNESLDKQEEKAQAIFEELQNFLQSPENPEWEEQEQLLKQEQPITQIAAMRMYLGKVAMEKSPSENVNWIRLINLIGKPILERVLIKWTSGYDEIQIREVPLIHGIKEALKNTLKVFENQESGVMSQSSHIQIHQDQHQGVRDKHKSPSTRPPPTEDNPLLSRAFPTSAMKTPAMTASMATTAPATRTSMAMGTHSMAPSASSFPSVLGAGTSGLTTEQCLLQVTAMLQKMNDRSPLGSTGGMVKLPTIELTPFNGDPLEFQEFWRRFESVVHNQKLSDSSKLIYLQSYLTSEAKMKCWGHGVDGQSYEDALKSVIKTFGDPDLLCAIYRDKIISQIMPSGPADIHGIRTMIQCTRKFMNCLRDPFKVDPITYSSTTMDVFKKRVPFELQMKIVEKTNQKISKMDLQSFIEALDEYCKNREDVSVFLEKTGSLSSYPGSSRAVPMTTMAATGRMAPGLSRCIFCDAEGPQGHRWKDCNVVTDPYQRLQVFRDQRRCTACGAPNHRWNQCPSERTCSEGACGQKHHVSLHKYFARQNRNQRTAPPPQAQEQQQQQQAQQQQGQQQDQQQHGDGSARRARTTLSIVNDGSVMMPILKGTICNGKPGPIGKRKMMSANIFLDGGSDTSYITRSAAKMLNLPIIWTGELNIDMIGGTTVAKTVSKTHAKLIGENMEEVLLDLYVLGDTLLEPIKTTFGSLQWLEVAQKNFPGWTFPQLNETAFMVDVLLGTDALPMVATNIIGHVGSLEARNSLVGPFVIGPVQQRHNEGYNTMSNYDDHGDDDDGKDTDEQPSSEGRIINIWM